MAEKIPTYQEFKAMGYPRLHKKLIVLIAQTKRLSNWFVQAEKAGLLPALLALRDLTSPPAGWRSDLVGEYVNPEGYPSYENALALLNLTPEQVRQWRHRATAAENDIVELLGENRRKTPVKSTAAARNAQALKHLRLLASAVLSGNEEQAEQFAAVFADLYQFY